MTTIRNRADLEASQSRDRDFVGAGYFYIDVRNTRADLALMHLTKAGYWTGDFIEQDVISESELVKAVEEAGRALSTRADTIHSPMSLKGGCFTS